MSTVDERTNRCVEEIMGGEISIGEALRKHFPEAESGNEEPSYRDHLRRTLRSYIRMWVFWNVPKERS